MKRNKIATIVLTLVFLVGLSLLLYPTVSDFWNSFHQSRAIAQYASQVEEIDQENYERIWSAAVQYNRTLLDNPDRFTMTEEEKAEYESLLSVSDLGIMGYIEIPEIDCSLPIYHGTDEAALQIAIGHLEGSSLPVGGKGTHCVLSGHRGLPSAKLFTNLDQLTEGDLFYLKILDETLTYEVDQILTVDPYDLRALEIDPEQDYCTLVTCTPYGINTQRLLVRGHRVETADLSSDVRVTADAMQVDPMFLVPLAVIPLLLLLFVGLLAGRRRRRHSGPPGPGRRKDG